MIIGVVSDTHKDKMNALPHIMVEFKKRKVEFIIHCGDINSQHLNPGMFNNLPVICALIEEQVDKAEFKQPPPGWQFTKPGDRIRDIGDTQVYVGHKRSFQFLTGSEENLIQFLNELRRDYYEVSWLFSGHTHHQIFQQSLINFVNPGAVADSFDGYEFAIIDTKTDQIVFSRLLRTEPTKKTFSIGVISDSMDISELDPQFWEKLTKEFKERDVSHIIHCGNIASEDIGREELQNFQIYYNLLSNQKDVDSPDNWHLISADYPVVEINGYRFYVQFDLGADLLDQSEVDMNKLCLNLRRQYPGISFILCGFTNDAFYEEGQQIKIINPGDINKDRDMVVICLPRTEITFGHIPIEPFPPIPQD